MISEKCTGCRACEMACPMSAIEMKANLEGFFEPHVVSEKCIQCGLCERICPQENAQTKDSFTQQAYATYILDDSILQTSTSGGFFTALALEILQTGGVVFGVTWVDEKVIHCMIDNDKDLYKVRGSKYLASDTADSYLKVQACLEQGKQVLYSGCPCQIAGLKSYLRKEYSNLLTVDIICHGTPSLKFYNIYKKGMEQKLGGTISDYQFRDKSKYGWGVYWSYVCSNGKKRTGGLHDDPYMAAFIDSIANRECCYQCKYVGLDNRPGDITLGDYWGIDIIHPEMASSKGVSAVITNTELGNDWVIRALSHCRYVQSTPQDVARYNPSLVSCSHRPAIRERIYDGINSKVPIQFVNENLYLPVWKKIRTRLRLIVTYENRIRIKKVKRALANALKWKFFTRK